MRLEEFFNKVWSDTQSQIVEYGLSEIALPRHVGPPKRFDKQNKTVEAHKFTSAEDYFRVQYFAFVDAVIQHSRAI